MFPNRWRGGFSWTKLVNGRQGRDDASVRRHMRVLDEDGARLFLIPRSRATTDWTGPP
jgi:hypothetical protein